MVVDPMCGSGTIVLEAADIAAGLLPGRSRRFAFAHLAGMAPIPPHIPPDLNPELRFYGYDRDQGAIQGAAENAKRAGVEQWCRFTRQALSDLTPPPGAPGFVLTNPPYGARIGDRKLLFGLYGALGAVLAQRFHNWQIGIITSDPGLAKATGLDLQGFGPIAHGGLKITLWHGRI
jgi:putative N6-adenine-specific DNA methylase